MPNKSEECWNSNRNIIFMISLVSVFIRSGERTWTEDVRERNYWEENFGPQENGEDYLLLVEIRGGKDSTGRQRLRWMKGFHCGDLYWFSCVSIMTNGGPYFPTSWVTTDFSRNIPQHAISWCLKKTLFWDMAPCRYCVNRRFGGTYRLHLQSTRKNKKIRERGTSWFFACGFSFFFYPEDGDDTFLRNVG
jgi:hypothetical protein